jgi:hypothetical protein
MVSVVDLFASQYGWRRDYILDDVPLEEYFYFVETIKKRKREEYLMQSHIHLLHTMKEEAIMQFLDGLQDHQKGVKEVKTDLEAFKRAKEQLNM